MCKNKTSADVLSSTRGLKFCLSHHLHTYFVLASNEGSGDGLLMLTDSSEPSLLFDAIRV